MFYLYILRCSDDSLYIGVTDDLEARIARHNRGEGSSHTARRTPATLVFAEAYRTRIDAGKRERQIKRWTRKKKEALIGGDLRTLKHL